jgi:hypothetical protein
LDDQKKKIFISKCFNFSDEAFSQTDDRPSFVISPDTLMLSGNGSVKFEALSLKKWQESKYAAPETFSAPVLADDQLEKVTYSPRTSKIARKTMSYLF